MSASLTINQNIIDLEYAVRGPIPQRAAELRAQGRKIIACNIGNPQALGQQPITFYREVLSLLEAPGRIKRERALKELLRKQPGKTPFQDFVSDYVLNLVEELLAKLPTGLGAYTESKGPLFIREAIARYIDRRDNVTANAGVPADPNSIFLTNGASEGAKYIIDMLIAQPGDGLMIPIPQYPLYSAAIRKAGGVQVNYYPDEDSGWTLNRSMLEESFGDAARRGVAVKGIVVINPSNPTGAILPEESAREVVAFAEEHNLALLADEVYQENLYGAEFISFARLVAGKAVPLFSLHSTSKGFYGECGHRGGYLEVRNPPRVAGTDNDFLDVLLKLASVSLCSSTPGQILTYLMVSPPEEGSEPYERFAAERAAVLRGLYDKATMIRGAFKEMEGVECFGRTGAMYLFPRLNRLPAGTTDFDYCMRLLEATGLCTVNGAGFGQREGTSHLRIAFLPPKELLDNVLPSWIEFHNQYVGRWRGSAGTRGDQG